MSALATFLDSLARECGGVVPFERFMREALYAPEFGYYSARLRTVGREGDFSTWPTLGNEPARALAAWFKKGTQRHLIEVGAGTGALARGVLRHMGFLRRLRTTYHIVDVSPALLAKQKELLGGFRVRWHATMSDALAACRGEADIISNELVDAFPCRIFVNDSGAWRELALRLDGGRAREELLDVPLLPNSSVFDIPHPPGQRVEVHESFRNWMGQWVGQWMSGRMLTVDYGGPVEHLYDRRPAGSVRAYARQQRLTGGEVYAAFGTRDITADVNFTDLERWGRGFGLRTDVLQPLGDFLAAQTRQSLHPRFEAAGAAFFVLCQTSQRTSMTSI